MSPIEASRRRRFFEGPARVLYRRAGARYFDVTAGAIVLNGIAVSLFGVITLVLYVDVGAGDLALFAACSAAAFAIEGAIAGAQHRADAAPVRAWLAGDRDEGSARRAWETAAGLPVGLLRRPGLYVVAAAGVGAAALVVASRLDLPAQEAALLFPATYLLFVYSTVLRFLALDFAMRPVLRDIGESLPPTSPPRAARVSLHRRLLATVPMVSWGTAVIVAGLLTENTRDLNTIGVAGLTAIGVTTAVSMWLSLVLADAVSGPLVELRDATRTVAAGNLAVRVPVVTTDETGELAASFNAMVAGLDERERLREAFGTFVDPALTERVLAEGTDLRGEEVDVSVLFVDVRGFTAFAESTAPHEVVATLNELFETIVPVVSEHGGHANKLLGDGLLAVFGAPQRQTDHARRAVAAAREIARRVPRDATGVLRVGIGINSGRVIAGTIGGGERRDFTVVGDTVNTAARVEQATRETGDDLLVTERTLELAGERSGAWVQRSAVSLRGKRGPTRLFAPVTGPKRPL